MIKKHGPSKRPEATTEHVRKRELKAKGKSNYWNKIDIDTGKKLASFYSFKNNEAFKKCDAKETAFIQKNHIWNGVFLSSKNKLF